MMVSQQQHLAARKRLDVNQVSILVAVLPRLLHNLGVLKLVYNICSYLLLLNISLIVNSCPKNVMISLNLWCSSLPSERDNHVIFQQLTKITLVKKVRTETCTCYPM